MNFTNVLQTKRNALRGSSVNNLSNLLATEDQQNKSSPSRAVIIKPTTAGDSNRSMTLPGKVNSSSQSNSLRSSPNSNHLPNRTQSSTSLVVQTNKNEQQNAQQMFIVQAISSLYLSCLPYINLLNINQDEIEEIWKIHINMNTTNLEKGINMLETFYLFKKLFKEICRRLNNLILECCHYLSRNTKLFVPIEKHLVNILDLINTKLECPVVYFDQEFLFSTPISTDNKASPNANTSNSSSSNGTSGKSNTILDIHKRIVWEIGENYDTFIYLKLGVIEVYFLNF